MMTILTIKNAKHTRKSSTITEVPDAKFDLSWHIQSLLDLHAWNCLFVQPVINSEKTGYYKLIVGEPVFENPCSYDAVEKVMYFMIHVLMHAHCMTHTMYAKQ